MLSSVPPPSLMLPEFGVSWNPEISHVIQRPTISELQKGATFIFPISLNLYIFCNLESAGVDGTDNLWIADLILVGQWRKERGRGMRVLHCPYSHAARLHVCVQLSEPAVFVEGEGTLSKGKITVVIFVNNCC